VEFLDSGRDGMKVQTVLSKSAHQEVSICLKVQTVLSKLASRSMNLS